MKEIDTFVFNAFSSAAYVVERDGNAVRIVDEECRLRDRVLVKAWEFPMTLSTEDAQSPTRDSLAAVQPTA